MTGFRNALLGAAGAATGGYSVDNSIVLDDGSSQYLSWTPSGAGTSAQQFTFSFWGKRCELDRQFIFGVDSTNPSGFSFNTDTTLRVQWSRSGLEGQLIDFAPYNRDPHAFSHWTIVWDTPNATSTDRIRAYQNGVRLSTTGTPTFPSQNDNESKINTAAAHDIGRYPGGLYSDIYLSEFVFIDGQALDPTSFGEYDTNGVWRPVDIASAGLAFGNNGFYLPFTDANALGADESISGDVSGGQYETNAVDTSNTASSYTFSSQDIGTADADRQVIVSTVTGGGASGINFSGVTVGGVTANQLLYLEGNDNNDVAFWVANVTTGTTADVVVSVTGGTMEKCGIGIWTINSATGLSVYDSYTEAATSSTPSGSVSCPANGIVLAVSGVQGSAGVCTISYTGATEVFDATIESGANASHAGTYDEYSTAQTVTITATASAATNRNSLAVVALNGANNFKTSGSPTQSSDTPTNLFCNITPIHPTWNAAVTISNGGLTVTGTAATVWNIGVASMEVTSGKWIMAYKPDQVGGGRGDMFVFDAEAQSRTAGNPTGGANAWGISFDTASTFVVQHDSSPRSITMSPNFATGDYGLIAFDADNSKVWLGWYHASAGTTNWAGSTTSFDGDPAAGTDETFTVTGSKWGFGLELYTGRSCDVDFGQSNLLENITIPTGFEFLNSANLYANAAPAVTDGSDVFVMVDDTESNIVATLAAAHSYSTYINIFHNLETSESWYWQFSTDSANCFNTDTTDAKETFPTLSGSDNFLGISINAAANGVKIGSASHTNGGGDTTVTHNSGVSRHIVVVFPEGGGTRPWFHPDFDSGKLCFTETSAFPATSSKIKNIGADSFDIDTGEATDTYWYIIIPEIDGIIDMGTLTSNGSTDGPLVLTTGSPIWTWEKRTASNDAVYMQGRNIDYSDEVNPYTRGLQLGSAAISASGNDTDHGSNFFKGRNSGQWNAGTNAMVYVSFNKTASFGATPATAR